MKRLSIDSQTYLDHQSSKSTTTCSSPKRHAENHIPIRPFADAAEGCDQPRALQDLLPFVNERRDHRRRDNRPGYLSSAGVHLISDSSAAVITISIEQARQYCCLPDLREARPDARFHFHSLTSRALKQVGHWFHHGCQWRESYNKHDTLLVQAAQVLHIPLLLLQALAAHLQSNPLAPRPIARVEKLLSRSFFMFLDTCQLEQIHRHVTHVLQRNPMAHFCWNTMQTLRVQSKQNHNS